MAISEAYTVTKTVSTTEWSITTDTAGPDASTTSGIYQCFVDLSAVAAGDLFQFAVYEKVLSGGTQRLIYSATFAGAQGAPGWVSPSLVLINGWDMTLLKISGTDRSISASIRRVA